MSGGSLLPVNEQNTSEYVIMPDPAAVWLNVALGHQQCWIGTGSEFTLNCVFGLESRQADGASGNTSWPPQHRVALIVPKLRGRHCPSCLLVALLAKEDSGVWGEVLDALI